MIDINDCSVYILHNLKESLRNNNYCQEMNISK